MIAGFNAFCYYLSTGTRASWGTVTSGVATAAAPSGLAVLKGMRDLSIGFDFTKIDASTRDSLGYKLTEPGLLDISLKFKLLDKGYTETTQQFLLQQAAQRLFVPLAVLDGPKAASGSFGVWADYKVTKFERGEPLDGELTFDVEMSPGDSSVPPQLVSVM